jgi:hypothetical protein
LEEKQLHSSHVIKAEEYDFEYVGSKKKEKFQRLNAFLSRSKHLNFVDTLMLAAILDFQLIIIIIYLHPLYLGVESHVTARPVPGPFPDFPMTKREKPWERGCKISLNAGQLTQLFCFVKLGQGLF